MHTSLVVTPTRSPVTVKPNSLTVASDISRELPAPAVNRTVPEYCWYFCTLHDVRVAFTSGGDGSVKVSWFPSGPHEAGVAPSSGQLQVWFEPPTYDPDAWQYVSAVKLQSAEPLTATKLQRFPWKRMLAVADSGFRALLRPDDDRGVRR